MKAAAALSIVTLATALFAGSPYSADAATPPKAHEIEITQGGSWGLNFSAKFFSCSKDQHLVTLTDKEELRGNPEAGLENKDNLRMLYEMTLGKAIYARLDAAMGKKTASELKSMTALYYPPIKMSQEDMALAIALTEEGDRFKTGTYMRDLHLGVHAHSDSYSGSSQFIMKVSDTPSPLCK